MLLLYLCVCLFVAVPVCVFACTCCGICLDVRFLYVAMYVCVLLYLCVCVCTADLVLGQRGLGLAVGGLALALTVVAPHRRATRRGRHTRHGADLCNLVRLCGWRTGRNHSLLKTDGQAACAGEGKHHLKHWRDCRDHCITCREETREEKERGR